MFTVRWTAKAQQSYEELRERAERSLKRRQQSKKAKSSKAEGLFKQVHKTVELLVQNPRHPGLQTHPYSRIQNPFDKNQKVFEAYAQNRTPGAYRVFWCYGPGDDDLTILAITPYP